MHIVFGTSNPELRQVASELTSLLVQSTSIASLAILKIFGEKFGPLEQFTNLEYGNFTLRMGDVLTVFCCLRAKMREKKKLESSKLEDV